MGTNNFVALATINPGDFGPQASVDLWTLVPTTGLAPQWNAICVGDFSGSIVVEASLDGINFNPVASFNLGFNQSGASFELSPVVVEDVVRYVRARVGGNALIRGPVYITLGGEVACDCASGAFPGYGVPVSIGPNEPVAGVSPLVMRADAQPGQKISARWSIAGARIFAIDGTNGDDNAAGFADSADTTAGNIAAATAAAGAVAKRTFAGLAAIFPQNGAGRRAGIVIRTGTYVGGLETFLQNASGYNRLAVNGTETQANAGSVAFAGDANANVFAGAVTVPGLNANGYNPTGAPTTTVIQMVLNGGGAPALPAEPAQPLGCRIRFDINTTTAALRGLCRAIIKVTGGDTVTIQTALTAVPVASDVFYIERGGVVCDSTSLSLGPTSSAVFLAGIHIAGNLQVNGGSTNWSLTTATGSFGIVPPAQANATSVFQNAAGTNARCGGSLRSESGLNGLGFNYLGLGFIYSVFVTNFQILNALRYIIQDGTVFAAGLFIEGGGNSTNINAFNGNVLGGATTAVPVRILGRGSQGQGLQIIGTRANFNTIDITGMGAGGAIGLFGMCDIAFRLLVSGSTGNNDVGLDLTNSVGSRIYLQTVPTVTGALGDVRLSNGTIITWAQAAAGIVDPNGNTIWSGTTSPLRPTIVANGANVIAWNNSPVAVAAPARHFTMPDGLGGVLTIPSLT